MAQLRVTREGLWMMPACAIESGLELCWRAGAVLELRRMDVVVGGH